MSHRSETLPQDDFHRLVQLVGRDHIREVVRIVHRLATATLADLALHLRNDKYFPAHDAAGHNNAGTPGTTKGQTR